MRAGTIVLATAAITIFLSAALAQQTSGGMITRIDRLNGTIAIEPSEGGTVGANTSNAPEQFKVKDASMLEAVHAGDTVTFSASENGGVKTITKLDKR
jgi:hypothetical protein